MSRTISAASHLSTASTASERLADQACGVRDGPRRHRLRPVRKDRWMVKGHAGGGLLLLLAAAVSGGRPHLLPDARGQGPVQAPAEAVPAVPESPAAAARPRAQPDHHSGPGVCDNPRRDVGAAARHVPHDAALPRQLLYTSDAFSICSLSVSLTLKTSLLQTPTAALCR